MPSPHANSYIQEHLLQPRLVFCRLAQAPPTQPDGLYINSSKIPEAAKTLDPGLHDATVAAWMTANGFHEVTNVKMTVRYINRVNGFQEMKKSDYSIYKPCERGFQEVRKGVFFYGSILGHTKTRVLDY